MTHTTPSSNKQLRKSRVWVHLLNSLCNSLSQLVSFTLGVNKYHDLVVLYITSLTEVYAIITIKHKDEEHWTTIWFAVLNLKFFQPTKCILNSWTTYWAVSTWHWWESAPSLIFQADVSSMLNRHNADWRSTISAMCDIACPRQESPIKNGVKAYEDPETGKLYHATLIMSDFPDIWICRELALPYS